MIQTIKNIAVLVRAEFQLDIKKPAVLAAAILQMATMTLLAFKAVATFLSWVEKQEDSETDAWIDEDEFEDA